MRSRGSASAIVAIVLAAGGLVTSTSAVSAGVAASDDAFVNDVTLWATLHPATGKITTETFFGSCVAHHLPAKFPHFAKVHHDGRTYVVLRGSRRYLEDGFVEYTNAPSSKYPQGRPWSEDPSPYYLQRTWNGEQQLAVISHVHQGRHVTQVRLAQAVASFSDPRLTPRSCRSVLPVEGDGPTKEQIRRERANLTFNYFVDLSQPPPARAESRAGYIGCNTHRVTGHGKLAMVRAHGRRYLRLGLLPGQQVISATADYGLHSNRRLATYSRPWRGATDLPFAIRITQGGHHYRVTAFSVIVSVYDPTVHAHRC